MEKDEPISDCDSNSSCGLPELWPEHTFDVKKLTRNDIVWAAYKDLHWPAIVRDVDKRNKKVGIWYLDSPGTTFKLPYKKIHDFGDSDFSKKVEVDAKKHRLAKKFEEVLRRTNLFIFRQCQGKEDNPLEFFDFTKPYFLLQNLKSVSSDKKSNVNIPAKKVADKKDRVENSEGESLFESDIESCTSPKYLPELCEEESPYDDEMIGKILSCITSGRVDNYLLDIANSKITNERHDLYFEAVKKDQIELFVESQPSVPIKSEKLHSVSVYLHSLYKQKKGREKINRLNEYIVSVWLPEAVDKAISLVEAEALKITDFPPGNEKSSTSLEAASDISVSGSSKAQEITDSPHGSEKSSPSLEVASDLSVSGSSKLSLSSICIESSESPLSSPTKVEVLKPLVESGSSKLASSLISSDSSNGWETEVSSSPTKVEVSKPGSNKLPSPALQVEPQILSDDSRYSRVLRAPKRKFNYNETFVGSLNYELNMTETFTPRKKKIAGVKKQKKSSKTLKRGQKITCSKKMSKSLDMEKILEDKA